MPVLPPAARLGAAGRPPAGQLVNSPSRGPPWRPGAGNCQLRAPPAGRSPGPGRARAARHRGHGPPGCARPRHFGTIPGPVVLSSTVKRPRASLESATVADNGTSGCWPA